MAIKNPKTGTEFKTDAEAQAFLDEVSKRADAAPPFPPKKKGKEEEEEEDDKKKEKKDAASVAASEALAAEKARADAATAELAAIKARDAQARKDALVAQARKVLGAEFKADEKTTEKDVHLAVLAKLKPEVKFDGADPAYVKAYFDIAIEAPAVSVDNRQDALLNQLYGVRADGTRSDGKDEAKSPRVDARTAMAQRDAAASKKPLGQDFFGK